jgi:transposase
MRRQSSKREFLKAARAWNDRARMVESPLFQHSDFFDPRDKVQVKYEMLRAHGVERLPVGASSRQFGFSRESFYAALQAFRGEGVVGLVDGKRGPKQPRKLTPAVRRLLVREIDRSPGVGSQELADRVAKELGITVHRRSIERFRSECGKKHRRRR